MKRRTLLRAGGTVVLAGLAGCSESSGGGGNPDDGDDAADPYGGWLDDASGDATPVDRTGSDRVALAVGTGDGFAFDPVAVEVSPGTTVVWEWTGRGGQHNVLHESGEFHSEFASSEGYTFEHTFRSADVYRYYCKPHRSLGMKGAVRVVA